MDKILSIRSQIINFYKKYEAAINFILKFFAGILIFSLIFSIGYFRDEFEPLFSSPLAFPFLMFMALLFCISPPTLANLFIGLGVIVQISASLELAVFLVLFWILVLVFYCRLAPKHSYLIIAMILGFYFKMPYAVVLFAGLYLGLTSIIPVAIGTFIWNAIPLISKTLTTAVPLDLEKIDIMALPTGFLDLYGVLYKGLSTNFTWIFASFIFAVVILIVYAISKLSIDFSKDIALGVGTILNIMGFIIINIVSKGNYQTLSIIVFSILSCLLVEFIRFFDSILNYKKVERVQFEDEDNYYYVKIIPKIVSRADFEVETKAASLKMASSKKRVIPAYKLESAEARAETEAGVSVEDALIAAEKKRRFFEQRERERASGMSMPVRRRPDLKPENTTDRPVKRPRPVSSPDAMPRAKSDDPKLRRPSERPSMSSTRAGNDDEDTEISVVSLSNELSRLREKFIDEAPPVPVSRSRRSIPETDSRINKEQEQ